jgi:pyruvate/2-oxoglutarate dehydrogenase complex dihydrolipoamide acyltransferase (E2) component
MIVDFKLPELGKDVVLATITTWHKAVGDTVGPGDTLLEVMTEKVSMEVESDVQGQLIEIVQDVDEEIAPGTVVARIKVTQWRQDLPDREAAQ